MAAISKDVHQSHNGKAIDSTHQISPLPAIQKGSKCPVWEIVVEIGLQIPDEEWAKVPDDASINYKHYLYEVSRKNV